MKPTQEQIAALISASKNAADMLDACTFVNARVKGQYLIRKDVVSDLRAALNAADMLEQLATDNARLRAALFECQEEIDDYIRHEYPHDHPVQERYRQRDYAANPARIALQEKDHD